MEGNYLLMFFVFYPIIGALFSYMIGRKNENLRDMFVIFITVSEFLLVILYGLLLPQRIGTEFLWQEFCGQGLHLKLDGFRFLFCTIASFMWVVTTIFSKDYLKKSTHRNRYYMFTLLTLGSLMGVFLSANLYTTFIFFEMMSFTSYVWIVQTETKAAVKASNSYITISVIGGLVMLMGLFLLQNTVGTLEISKLINACMNAGEKEKILIAGLCIAFGFAAKAGAVPLHTWLPTAHPVAPAPASALLSGILTKSGIFGILIVSCNLFLHDKIWGMLVLIIGVLTMVNGAVLALFSVDLKRTLACSSMSQIGFILVGIGMMELLGAENALAAHGSVLHMVNHALMKTVLFMAAGVVVMNTEKFDLNDVRGFGRKKPILHISFLAGVLGIGGIPLFSGYISKTLLHESIAKAVQMYGAYPETVRLASLFQGVEWLFLLSGGLTVAYMMKLYIVLFIEKNTNEQVQEKYDSLKTRYMSKASAAVLLISASLLPIFGTFTRQTMDKFAAMSQEFLHARELSHAVEYFRFVNLKGAFISIGIGLVIYIVVVRGFIIKKNNVGNAVYVNRWPRWMNIEKNVYVPVIMKALPSAGILLCRICDTWMDGMIVLLRKTIYSDKKPWEELEEGNALTHTVGTFLDYCRKLIRKVSHKELAKPISYTHRLAVLYNKITESNRIIGRSLSFGLFMFCFGLVLTLIYLLRFS